MYLHMDTCTHTYHVTLFVVLSFGERKDSGIENLSWQGQWEDLGQWDDLSQVCICMNMIQIGSLANNCPIWWGKKGDN